MNLYQWFIFLLPSANINPVLGLGAPNSVRCLQHVFNSPLSDGSVCPDLLCYSPRVCAVCPAFGLPPLQGPQRTLQVSIHASHYWGMLKFYGAL